MGELFSTKDASATTARGSVESLSSDCQTTESGSTGLFRSTYLLPLYVVSRRFVKNHASIILAFWTGLSRLRTGNFSPLSMVRDDGATISETIMFRCVL